MKTIKIAVDGHSSCGKSTLAKQIAKHFGFVYIDTGAMYRTVALYAMRNNMIGADGTIDQDALLQSIGKIKVAFLKDGHATLNGEDVESQIRTLEVSGQVSKVAALKFVREAMVDLQRQMAQNQSVVMDGRDIGTVVFPDAELKIFLTASDQVRAQRRYDEMIAKGEEATLQDVLDNIRERDLLDSTRTESPLKKAADAVLLDNSCMTREEQFEVAKNLVERTLNELKNE
ncbi:MAG: (d)CMP kinase [Bacteroidales bacterium]|nr:(d)CMP kinase [Bacteroidales bacterium]